MYVVICRSQSLYEHVYVFTFATGKIEYQIEFSGTVRCCYCTGNVWNNTEDRWDGTVLMYVRKSNIKYQISNIEYGIWNKIIENNVKCYHTNRMLNIEDDNKTNYSSIL